MARRLPIAAMGAVVALFAAGARPAGADDPDEPRSRQAQALFDRGRELMASGDLDQGCTLLAESQRLDPGGGTLLNLAVCHEKQGKLATAWTEFHDALGASVKDERKDRQEFATERIRLLEARLPHLVVDLPPSAPVGTVVKLDGEPLSTLAAGSPLPVDLGPHRITATAPGYTAWASHDVTAIEGKVVEVKVPALVLLPPPGVPRAHLGAGSYVAGGVALAGFATMAITGALALSAEASAESLCSSARDFCEPGGESDASRAHALAWASTISMGAALAATVLAIVWPRRYSVEQPAPAAVPAASGLRGTGVQVSF